MWTSHDRLNKLFRAGEDNIIQKIKKIEMGLFPLVTDENYCATKNKITGLNFFKLFFMHYESAFSPINQLALVENYCVFIDDKMAEHEYLHAPVLISSYLYKAVPVHQGVFGPDNRLQPVQSVTILLRIDDGKVIPFVDPVILLLKLSVLSRNTDLVSTSDALMEAFEELELREFQDVATRADAAANAVESELSRLSSPLPQPSQDDSVAGTPPGQIIPPLTVRSMNAIRRERATRAPDAQSRELNIPESMEE